MRLQAHQDRGVELARHDALQQDGRGAGLDVDLDVRMRPHPAAQQGRNQPHQRRGRCAQPHGAGRQAGVRGGRAQVALAAQQFAGAVHDARAGHGRPDRPSRAREQPRAQVGLEGAYLLRDRRGRQAEPARGVGDRAGLGHRDEAVEESHVHKHVFYVL